MSIFEGVLNTDPSVFRPIAVDANGNILTSTGASASPLPAGEAHIGEVGGKLTQVTVELTRPADTNPYTDGDIVSNSTTATTLLSFAGLARVSGGSGYIVGARISTDKKSITPRFRIHLFRQSNPTIAADNAPHKELYADNAKRAGFVDLDGLATAKDATNSDMSRSFKLDLRIPFTCAAGETGLYVALETLDAFTPNSGQKFNVTLIADNN